MPAKKQGQKSASARTAKAATKKPAASKSSKKADVKTAARAVSKTVTKAMSQAMSKVTSSARKVARTAEETDFRGGAKRVGGAIASATRNLTGKLHLPKSLSTEKAAGPKAATPKTPAAKKQTATRTKPSGQPSKKTAPRNAGSQGSAAGTTTRTTRRTADVPLNELASNYTPGHTSLKSSFREGGVARTQDQEMGGGFSSERWNDEDHFTNKSGDPRIGTHGRTYEPDEEPSSGRKS